MLLLTCNRENGSPCWEVLKYDFNFDCLSSALMPALFSPHRLPVLPPVIFWPRWPHCHYNTMETSELADFLQLGVGYDDVDQSAVIYIRACSCLKELGMQPTLHSFMWLTYIGEPFSQWTVNTEKKQNKTGEPELNYPTKAFLCGLVCVPWVPSRYSSFLPHSKDHSIPH